jgi:ornithine cyclodeaminase/alanine dehydrogenase-like protein (mu-crystallin family)
MNAETVVLGARDVARHGTIRECIDRSPKRYVFTKLERAEGRPRALHLPEGNLQPSWRPSKTMGRIFVAVKANVNVPGNPIRHGRPTIKGALILLDGDGRPLAIMDSIALPSLRTAAVAALAAEHLALSDSRPITIVGCREQARHSCAR